jgi:hypothetical protein
MPSCSAAVAKRGGRGALNVIHLCVAGCLMHRHSACRWYPQSPAVASLT